MYGNRIEEILGSSYLITSRGTSRSQAGTEARLQFPEMKRSVPITVPGRPMAPIVNAIILLTLSASAATSISRLVYRIAHVTRHSLGKARGV